MSDLPFVDVITVLWNSARFMPALFEGLVKTNYPRDRWRFHVVDNNPGDGSLEEVRRQIAKWGDQIPEVKIYEPGTNTGFAGGNNLVMRASIASGTPYVYLLNHDAAFEPDALMEAVRVAESDVQIGSVQSLMVLQDHPEEVNSRGNAIHYLGMGYCLGYHEVRSKISNDVRDIAYASGGAVLYSTRALKGVGLLDETLWLYHEDLDLGWRLLLAGYRNVMAPQSVVRHRYEFSRSISKWYWMERNRIACVFKNYHVLTIVLLLPQLLIADLAILIYAIKGGFWKEKLKAWWWFVSPRSWAFLLRGRQEIHRIRRVTDRQVLKSFTPYIDYQEYKDPVVAHIVNPAWSILFSILKILVRW